MSLREYTSASSGGHSSPANYNEWIARDFPEDLLVDSYEQPLTLTPEEERLFRSFGDGVASSLGCSLQRGSEPLDEKQVVFAEAQAAGLFKGGIRRAAFSMGDLQALQPPEYSSPSSPTAQNQRPPVTTVGASRPPRLESVPESKALPASSSSLLGSELLLNTRVSSLSGGGSMSDGTLEGLALDQLSTELMGESSSGPFDSQGTMPSFSEAVPMLDERQPGASQIPCSLPAQPVIKEEAGLDEPSLLQPMERSQDLPATSSPRLAGFFDYSLMNGSGDRKPPLAPASSSYSPPLVDSESVIALRGYADELLGSSMPGIPKVPPPANARQGNIGLEGLDEQKEKEREQQRERMLRRSQSAVELRSLGGGLPRHGSTGDLTKRQFTVELTTPEGHIYTAGRLSNEERAQKILRYRQKRHERNFNKRIKYMCRKTLADSRPRVRGRFARNDDVAAVMPHETKKALAEKARKEKKGANARASNAQQSDSQLEGSSLLEDSDFSALMSSETGGPGFSQSNYLPSNEAFNFPPVPMDLYGGGMQQGSHK